MNNYEFTRIGKTFELTERQKRRAFDADILAFKIEYNSKTDLREDPDYKDAKEWFLDTTLSCNEAEAISWMRLYMSKAIAYGMSTKEKDWRTKFLAAYDLFVKLTKGRYTMSDEQTKFLQMC